MQRRPSGVGLWMVLLSACGSTAPSPAPASDDPGVTAPSADLAPASAPACSVGSDCHYNDPCAPSACGVAPTPNHGCADWTPAAGPCGCVEGRCAMIVAGDRGAFEGEPESVEPEPACTTDDTCFFDDACVPTACATAPPAAIECEETAPPPGDCRCIAGACVMRRHRASRSDEACSSSNACGFCVAEGTCEPGQDNEHVSAPPGVPYPICRCGGGPGPGPRCNLGWVDPVSCTSVDDCWVESGPLGRVPVTRPRRFRGREFRPCVDGEVRPACEFGFCVVDMRFAFSC